MSLKKIAKHVIFDDDCSSADPGCFRKEILLVSGVMHDVAKKRDVERVVCTGERGAVEQDEFNGGIPRWSGKGLESYQPCLTTMPLYKSRQTSISSTNIGNLERLA